MSSHYQCLLCYFTKGWLTEFLPRTRHSCCSLVLDRNVHPSFCQSSQKGLVPMAHGPCATSLLLGLGTGCKGCCMETQLLKLNCDFPQDQGLLEKFSAEIFESFQLLGIPPTAMPALRVEEKENLTHPAGTKESLPDTFFLNNR